MAYKNRELANTDFRYCNKCERVKRKDEFHKLASGPFGVRYCCKTCLLSNRSAWRKQHQPREAQRARRYRQANAPKVKAQKREFSIKNKAKIRWAAILCNYNLTQPQFEAILEKQGKKCAICLRHKPGGRGSWHVDHDKRCCPGKKSCGRCVRGLLCTNCNVGIGHLGDNAAVLFNAIFYLGKPPAKGCYPANPENMDGFTKF